MMKAVVVEPNAPAHLALENVEPPKTGPADALVRVMAISLNHGDVYGAQYSSPGHRPGWDLAGIVEQSAADGSGAKAGARVVGFVPSGAWAELVAVPTKALAELPEGVSFAQAATLPVAGHTALYCLEKAGGLLDKEVLITGASGGVGNFAIQLAQLAGARVIGQVRRADRVTAAREAGADEVVVSEDGMGAAQFGPYDLIVDGVGGPLLSNALGMLARGGKCVVYGSAVARQLTFDLVQFFFTGGASLYGFILFYEVLGNPASDGLQRLADLVAAGKVRPYIGVEVGWDEIGHVAQRLLDRDFAGKAVLHVNTDRLRQEG
jgi:NADPH2:quinone reductase